VLLTVEINKDYLSGNKVQTDQNIFFYNNMASESIVNNTHDTETVYGCLFFHWIEAFQVSKPRRHVLKVRLSYYTISVEIHSTNVGSHLSGPKFTHHGIWKIEKSTYRPKQITIWNNRKLKLVGKGVSEERFQCNQFIIC